MEENKRKVVPMEAQKQERMSYEQLENAAHQLSMQLQRAQQQIGQMSEVLTKLPFLFKVVELGDKHFNTEFVVKCATEIEDILQPKEEAEEPDTKEE